ncbi:hypothetical protein RhiirA5_444331 [Rhizophagus irregularis]|uniref:Uncharacterized protein n=1 Tax=Rhizophagus irregularis TaxID=588596 RepID=A0A2N0ND69_9GLOM|nr:hypothetical protein RhiirA5_444331 [Rhizophagus irregularis]
MTTINPSQSEIFSFDIPGYKIIIIPTFPQQDNTYSNYSSLVLTVVEDIEELIETDIIKLILLI